MYPLGGERLTSPLRGGDAEPSAYLGGRGVDHGRPVRELQGRYGLVAAVNRLDELGRRWVLLDVDLCDLDAVIGKRPLEALAEYAPRGGVHRDLCRHRPS